MNITISATSAKEFEKIYDCVLEFKTNYEEFMKKFQSAGYKCSGVDNTIQFRGTDYSNCLDLELPASFKLSSLATVGYFGDRIIATSETCDTPIKLFRVTLTGVLLNKNCEFIIEGLSSPVINMSFRG